MEKIDCEKYIYWKKNIDSVKKQLVENTDIAKQIQRQWKETKIVEEI